MLEKLVDNCWEFRKERDSYGAITKNFSEIFIDISQCLFITVN